MAIPSSRPLDVVPTEASARALDERVGWAAHVQRSLAALNPTQRGVLTLSYFSQLTQPDIAVRLGIPLHSVQSGAASGLRQLAVLLEAP